MVVGTVADDALRDTALATWLVELVADSVSDGCERVAVGLDFCCRATVAVEGRGSALGDV